MSTFHVLSGSFRGLSLMKTSTFSSLFRGPIAIFKLTGATHEIRQPFIHVTSSPCRAAATWLVLVTYGTGSIMNIFHTVPAATMVAECIVHIAGVCVSVCHTGAKEHMDTITRKEKR